MYQKGSNETITLKGGTPILQPTYKYKYNGKELESELGLNTYAYGWRDYDPAIGRFTKIDRFAEKYMDRNPYNYGANNPIYYIDVAGDSLYVSHRKGFLGLGGKETLLYENGNLYNKDGSEYSGKKKGFLKKVTNALAEISKSQEGADMMNELQSSNNSFTIEKGSSEFHNSNTQKAYANQIQTDPAQSNLFSTLSSTGFNFNGGAGGTIFWNPSGSLLPTTSGMQKTPLTDLAHEMFHALDSNRGMMDGRVEQGVKRNEWQAVYRENNLRTQLGLPQRTHYIILSNLSTNSRSGTGPRMLTPAPLNQNIKPVWY